MTSSSLNSPDLANAASLLRQYISRDIDHLYFQARYVSWSHEQKRQAELKIALQIIERNLSLGNVSPPKGK